MDPTWKLKFAHIVKFITYIHKSNFVFYL